MRYALILVVLFAATTANAQWEIQTAPTTADLRGIDNVGKGIVWASGSDGTVLRTTDDGAHWQLCPTPPGAEKLDFRGIQAFDEKTAIVMSTGKGPLSRLYKTTDACQSWKLLFTNPDPEGSWAAFTVDEKYWDKEKPGLIILGNPISGQFVMWWSENGENDWKRWQTRPSTVGEVVFAASNTGLANDSDDGIRFFGTGGPQGARLFTECEPCTTRQFEKDGIFVQPMSMFAKGRSVGIFSIAFKYQRAVLHVVAVGGDSLKPNEHGDAAYSDWIHWHAAATPPHGFRSAVAYDAATKTWITVGPNGTDISTDDGRNWRALRPNSALHEPEDADRDWNALSLPFVVGPHGRIGRLRPAALKAGKP
jgi:photosystem II stability/assembly factor-like uncharacterized protein